MNYEFNGACIHPLAKREKVLNALDEVIGEMCGVCHAPLWSTSAENAKGKRKGARR